MAINTSTLKSYAPQARRDFITAVKSRAARFGITEDGSASIQEQGDVAIINGQAYPRIVARQCRDLEGKIRTRGFDAVMEEVAYTWFNRFAAIRYMEVHGYLDHGFRVLSHPTGETTPEIVQHAEKAKLPGLKADRVVELKLDGRKDEELYRMLLVGQCNALHAAMPFLFERIGDETELLLPDNLLHSDSVIREMIDRIPEVDWQEIEIIGWLYQFYISEKKDQVIGKVVKSEDIPAATQLFTPNWIVKYMVQNSLGAKWLATYPDSPIKAKMEYYIEPAEQPDGVRRQIEAETPDSLDPEKLTFLDPANGSGHILVEAYDLFKEIYLERGYRLRDIPRLILEKNLYGLDIDDRAAQLAGFALMMRARSDDRGILSVSDPVRLNVIAIQESNDLDPRKITRALWPQSDAFELVPTLDLLPETVPQPSLRIPEQTNNDSKLVTELIALFENARTYGSLLQVPESVGRTVSALINHIESLSGDSLLESTERQYLIERVLPVLSQAKLLVSRYDVVAANPPYMGAKGMNPMLKAFASSEFPDSKSDLFAMFMERALQFTLPHGSMAMINMQAWMFLSSYERLRGKLLSNATIQSMAHLGERAFDSIGGAVVSTTAFVMKHVHFAKYKGAFVRLIEGRSEAEKDTSLRRTIQKVGGDQLYLVSAEDFEKIPGSPISYWLGERTVSLFSEHKPMSDFATAKIGLMTSDNGRFMRFSWEVSRDQCCFDAEDDDEAAVSGKRWFPHNKGGGFRRWSGNREYLVNWQNYGDEIKKTVVGKYPYLKGNPQFVVHDEGNYFRPAISWSETGGGLPAFRYFSNGFTFNIAGISAFPKNPDHTHKIMAFCNSAYVKKVFLAINPTLHFGANNFHSLPAAYDLPESVADNVSHLISSASCDWDSFETSWDFVSLPLLSDLYRGSNLAETFSNTRAYWQSMVDETRRLEEENNRTFISAFGLQDEIAPDVPLEEISLTCNPAYRYGVKTSVAEREDMLRADTLREFISYGVGCMFGRFSLDEPGFILVNQGATINDFFAKVPNATFRPDEDNIIPMLDDNWFEDDVTDRFVDFLRDAFGVEKFDENLSFIEKSIGKDIRKFFKRDFFSDHLKRYKRRPIYWVFSSGKEKAFEAIVYMHRYNETTLARMRMNYVVPLQSQMTNRIERLATELSGANLSSAERKRKDTQRAKLIKQLEELGRFEEELRHLADQRIRIDLDDGVKVNYGKFGNLLAEVKAVTGGGDD